MATAPRAPSARGPRPARVWQRLALVGLGLAVGLLTDDPGNALALQLREGMSKRAAAP